MKTITRIARTELASLFFSPIAWFILVVFSVITGYGFWNLLQSVAGHEYDISVTQLLFMDSGLFSKISSSLYIYIPLLTMGLISSEVSSGSIKLPYSSPITSFEFVAGKYLASITFGLTLLIVPVIAIVYSAAVVPHFDLPAVLTGLFGLWLLICTYCAVGLFMSSLTSYQVVAALYTFIALAAMRYVGSIGQDVDWISEITYWLSLNGRAEYMFAGALRSVDIAYFIIIIALFVAAATLRIAMPRRSIGGLKRAAIYLATVAIAVAAAFVTSRQSLSGVWDSTNDKRNSISATSREIVSQIKGPITVTNYINLLDNMSFRYLPNKFYRRETIFDNFRLFRPDIEVRRVYYYSQCPGGFCQIPKVRGKSLDEIRDYAVAVYNLNPSRYKSLEQLSATEQEVIKALEEDNHMFVRVIRDGDGNEALLRNFQDMDAVPSETEITTAFKRLTGSSPKVAMLTGNGSREIYRGADRDYNAFTTGKYQRYSLETMGFDVYDMDFSQGGDIPDDIDIAIIADVARPYDQRQMQAVDRFVERGGNLLIMADAGRREVMNPLLEKFGVRLRDGLLVQPTEDFSADFIVAKPTEAAASVMPEFKEKLTDAGLHISMPACAALDFDEDGPFRATPLFCTDSKGVWVETQKADVNEVAPTCNPAAGEREGSYTTAVALERTTEGRSQRIIVFGDADCFSNSEMTIQREYGKLIDNYSFAVECFRYLSGGEYPVKIERRKPADTEITVSEGGLKFGKTLFLFLLPVLLLATGVLVRIVRSRN